MKRFLLLCLIPVVSFAEDMSKECSFVATWANRAYHFSHTIGLEENSFHIENNGWTPEEYDVITQIKKEAYHDLDALRKRVEAACAAKEAT